jgi:hypothetical protein
LGQSGYLVANPQGFSLPVLQSTTHQARNDDLANVIAGVAYCAVSRFTSSVSELRILARDQRSRAVDLGH